MQPVHLFFPQKHLVPTLNVYSQGFYVVVEGGGLGGEGGGDNS